MAMVLAFCDEAEDRDLVLRPGLVAPEPDLLPLPPMGLAAESRAPGVMEPPLLMPPRTLPPCCSRTVFSLMVAASTVFCRRKWLPADAEEDPALLVVAVPPLEEGVLPPAPPPLLLLLWLCELLEAVAAVVAPPADSLRDGLALVADTERCTPRWEGDCDCCEEGG